MDDDGLYDDRHRIQIAFATALAVVVVVGGVVMAAIAFLLTLPVDS